MVYLLGIPLMGNFSFEKVESEIQGADRGARKILPC